MNTPESVECPSCENEVEPVKRKLPGEPDKNGRIGSPIVQFGHVCPVCSARLDPAIEKLKREREANEPIESNVVRLPERKPPSESTRKSVAVPGEELIDRIRREHADALREEQELIARLDKVRSTRETLDRLMNAIGADPASVAAE